MSELEDLLAAMIADTPLEPPVRQFKAVPDRRFRFDFAWPKDKLLVEVQGGGWVRGRHNRPAGQDNDYEKHNLATLLGYRVILVTGKQIREGDALCWIAQGLGFDLEDEYE